MKKKLDAANRKTKIAQTTEATDSEYCCFLDILGFKQMLEDFDSSAKLYKLLVDEIITNDALLKAIAPSHEELFGSKAPQVSFRVLSDSIVITSKSWPMVLAFAKQFQGFLFGHGVLVRGGIGFGRHAEFSRAVGVAIVSEALSRAYVAESKLAIYPRIIFDISALQAISDSLKFISIAPFMNNRFDFVMDDLGTWFLNIVFDTHDTPHLLLKSLYEKSSSEDVMRKIRWLIDFYNFRRFNPTKIGLPLRTKLDFGRGTVIYQQFGYLSYTLFDHITPDFTGNVFQWEDWNKHPWTKRSD